MEMKSLTYEDAVRILKYVQAEDEHFVFFEIIYDERIRFHDDGHRDGIFFAGVDENGNGELTIINYDYTVCRNEEVSSFEELFKCYFENGLEGANEILNVLNTKDAA